MPRSVEIAAGKTNVVLPDGRLYNEGDTTTLTDDEWEQVDQDLVPGTIIDNGTTAPSLGAAATDPASTMALANAMRLAMIDAGLATA